MSAPWYAAVPWRDYGNASLNDCLVAAACNWIVARSRAVGRPIVPTDATALNVYEFLTNFQGGEGQPVNEAALFDYWRCHDVAGVRISGWDLIPHRDHDAVRRRLAARLCLFVVLRLPQDAAATVWSGEIGTVNHAVLVVGADSDGLVCVSAGRLQRIAWPYWDPAVLTVVDPKGL